MDMSLVHFAAILGFVSLTPVASVAQTTVPAPKYVGVLGQPGGAGKWPAVVEVDPSLPSDVLYHPVKMEGQLPVVIFAPGGCRNDGLYTADILKDVASHGYMVIAIGVATNGRGEQEVIPGTERELFEHGALP